MTKDTFDDIIYDERTKKVLQVISFDQKVAATNTSNIINIFNPHRVDPECHPILLPWCKNVPKEVMKDPHDYEVVYENNYNKPTKIRGVDGKLIDLGFNTKILDGKIIWFGSFLDYISYSNITRDAAFDLLDRGYNIKFYSTKPSGCVEIGEEDQQKYESAKIDLEGAFCQDLLKVCSYVPLSKIPFSTQNVCYTMLETISVDQYIIDGSQSYNNEIWVPTEFSKKQFQEKMYKDVPIHVMPLWFDETKFHPEIKEYDCEFNQFASNGTYPKNPSGFKFLYVSRLTWRKGFDVLLKAYIEEFDPIKDDVSLVMFCRHILNVGNAKDVLKQQLNTVINKYDPSKIPPLYVHSDPVPLAQQGNIFGWGDCNILPSRGEGFGLGAIEAAACKIPQILTNHTGMSDFVDDSVALVLDVDEIDSIGKMEKNFETGKIEYSGRFPDAAHYVTPYYNGALFAVLGRPAIEQLKAHMRFMYENSKSDDIDKKINKFYKRVYKKYTKTQCLSNIRSRIDHILRENS